MSKFYGQLAEDLIIDELLDRPYNGFYIDIGANDPENLSNTKRFYDRGWRGINIEPHPGLFEKLQAARPRDNNLNIGIGTSNKPLPFYVRDPHYSSSFVNHTGILYKIRNRHTKLIKTVPIPVMPLSSLAVPHKIDFINIDVEGNEMDVLLSNDWSKITPDLFVIELNQSEQQITEYLSKRGYTMVYKNILNGFYQKEQL